FVLLLVKVRVAPLIQGQRILRVQTEGPVQIGDGPVELFSVRISGGPAGEGGALLRMPADDPGKTRNGLAEVSFRQGVLSFAEHGPACPAGLGREQKSDCQHSDPTGRGHDVTPAKLDKPAGENSGRELYCKVQSVS